MTPAIREPESKVPWNLALATAQAQLGVISWEQLQSCGVSRSAIGRAVAAARIESVCPRVYRISGSPRSWLQDVMSVSLYAGPSAVISDTCAAAIWELPHFPRRAIHISTPRRLRGAPLGTHIHNRQPFSAMERAVFMGIPITSAARTLLDISSVAPYEHVEDAVDDALRRGLTKIVVVRWLLKNVGGRGHPGSATLGKIISERQPGYVPSESVLESEFLRLLKERNFPLPTKQVIVRVNGRFLGRIDFMYGELLAIEVDGAAWHLSLNAWERDLRRQNELVAEGKAILRFTRGDIKQQPDEVISLLKRALRLYIPELWTGTPG